MSNVNIKFVKKEKSNILLGNIPIGTWFMAKDMIECSSNKRALYVKVYSNEDGGTIVYVKDPEYTWSGASLTIENYLPVDDVDINVNINE